ncbi:hypothetical protein HDR67_02200, partial [bacterium]|nr:hypothetical protein [bacterium]
MDMIRFFIAWGPTFLFIVIILIGILIGCLRGFRKSLILFIHMLAALIICLIVFLCVVNNPNFDANMIGFVNGFLRIGGTNLQKIFDVSQDCRTLHEIIAEVVTRDFKEQDMGYFLIYENLAYLQMMINMTYRCILAMFCFVLYFNIIFFLYIIYHIAYPVRRKIKKMNMKFQNGEIKKPYNRRRWAGCIIGGVRSIITGVICFSFLGALLFVITGGVRMPQRNEIKEEEVSFTNETFNQVYDYYSYVCEMGNTGIFQVLNSMKDSSNTPYYFYFADLVFQGTLKDEALGINEKVYLRDEIGEYSHFVNGMLAIFMKYSGADVVNDLLEKNDQEETTRHLIAVMGNEGFAQEFSQLIDEFEGNLFMTNLCLSVLTSFINHIDSATKHPATILLVNQLFKSEDGIKVTDLATEQDIKSVFKGLVSAVSDVASAVNQAQEEIAVQKQLILIAQKFLPVIQNLSIISSRKEIGNRIFKNLYLFCSENLIEEEIKIEIPEELDWVAEFQILLDSCDSMLTISYHVVDKENDVMINNIIHMFTGENAEVIEAAYDKLTAQLTSSKVLDVVFKSSLVGDKIDDLIHTITNSEDAKIPKNIDYVGKEGECSILLNSLKIMLKNGGGDLLSTMLKSENEEFTTEDIMNIVTVFTKKIEYEGETTSLLNIILKSKLLHYMISSYLMYAEFGTFKLYIPSESLDIIEDCRIIKHNEIDVVVNLLSNCTELITELIEHPDNIDYANLLSNTYIQDTAEQSLILQGTLANTIIGISKDNDVIILPLGYEDPEQWISSNDQDGETVVLLKAIFKLSKVKIDEDSYLVNDLLNGKITPKVLLDLDQNTIDSICQSKILRYTMSDMVTDLGDQSFKIVVAHSSLETVNAPTTTSKTVNVIRTSELSAIFTDIKKIVILEDNGTIKLNYNAIFKNKQELCINKTIAATLIQAIFDNNGDGFLVVPQQYVEDFEKIKTEDVLEENAWFGQIGNVADDELYLMFSAIETLLDKDENGDISNDFDFNTIQNDLKLRRNGIGSISSSVILNASISKQIVQKFYVPIDSYEDLFIIESEFKSFFDAIFEMFDKTEIYVQELVKDDIFNVMFRKAAISTILDSKIMKTTISKRMDVIDQIKIPIQTTTTVTYVEKDEEGYSIDTTELNKVFEALFVLLDTDTIMVNDMTQKLETLELHKDSIDRITQSVILRASVSEKLTSNDELVILNDVASLEELIYSNQIYILNEVECNALLNSIFEILDEEKVVINELSQKLNDLVLSKEDLPVLLTSKILQATLSKNLIQTNELQIPSIVLEQALTIRNDIEDILVTQELDAFFTAVFATTNRVSGKGFTLSTMNLPTTLESANQMTASLIVSATLSNKITTGDTIVKVVDELKTPYIYAGMSSSETYIAQSELSYLLLAMTKGLGKTDPNALELDDITIPKTDEQKQALVSSEI